MCKLWMKSWRTWNAFLHWDLKGKVHMEAPLSLESDNSGGKVCKSENALSVQNSHLQHGSFGSLKL